ncbi:heme-binding domain-containing protein [Pendulispora brunnea]|uniref:Heme-binding domain-containing protein n=1 Tax=Pendulispora brunnea TaxID=2905690 RepID=A0ABZ2KAP1_9BACT
MFSFITKKWHAALAVGAVAAVGLQFVRPKLENPPVTGDISAPEHVKEILQRACYDCHSNETHLAWFDQISPAIWLVAADVKEARSVLNFSYWEQLSMDQRKAKFFEALNQATFETMPPAKYTALHPSAKLTANDIAVLKNYLATLIPKPVPNAEKTAAGDVQYVAWTHAVSAAKDVRPSANDLVFMPEYKDWAPISMTDRPDQGAMKVITGNDVAVKAVRNHQTNPWPDGAVLAKMQFEAVTDAHGTTRTGEFKQVAFMIKDAKKYASTQGWGYARWKGTSLEPGDKDPSFTMDCVNCHAPMHDYDFVFSNAIDFAAKEEPFLKPTRSDTRNVLASLTEASQFDSREWKVMSAFVERTPNTMSMLFGNDLALKAGRAGHAHYPPGAELSLVTWKSQEDDHWFGAYIPGGVQSIERVTFSTAGVTYARFEGSAFTKRVGDPAMEMDRISYIANQRASVMP